MVVLAIVTGQVVSETGVQPDSSEFQRAADTMQSNAPSVDLFVIAFFVAASLIIAQVLYPVLLRSYASLKRMALTVGDRLSDPLLPLVLDRVRLGETTLGWSRHLDEFAQPFSDGQSTADAIRWFSVRDSTMSCAHCGAEHDLDDADSSDTILKRARRDFHVGPVVASRQSQAVNLYCDEDCEAGRLDPLLESARDEEGAADSTDVPVDEISGHAYQLLAAGMVSVAAAKAASPDPREHLLGEVGVLPEEAREK